MDPVTVVGLVAGIVQLIDTTTKAIKYINDVKDAPRDRARLAREAASLLALLTDLRYRLEETTSTDPWFTGIRSLGVEGGLLEQFNEAIDNLAKKLKPEKSLKKLTKAVFWPFEKHEINNILTKIERLKTFVDLALQKDHFALSRAIKEDVTGMAKESSDQRSRDVIAWISTLNFSTKQNDFFSRRQEGTGRWVLEAGAFADWMNGTERTLWCPGLPGAGKTILMCGHQSIVVDYLKHSIEREDVAIMYIYCSYKEKDDQTAANLVASLLQQLVQKSPVVSGEILSLYDYHTKNGSRPTLGELSKMLQLESRRFSKVFVLIDALDEWPESSGIRTSLLTEIRKLPSSIYLLVTSRHSSTIEREFEKAGRLEIRASDEDVRRYLECRVNTDRQLVRLVHKYPVLRENIISTIVEKAKGMFLLAQLHVSSLAKKDNCRDVRRALRNLPKELDDTYNEAMQRIWSQDHDKVKRARQILSWISFALRPLTIREVQHALAVEPEDTDIDEEALPDQDLLVSVCAGLVTIEGESNIIRLVHYTAQEYFERIRLAQFPYAQISIATTCLTYVSFNVFAKGPCLDDKEMETRLREYPLLEYAAQHWGDHARGDPEETIKELALKFLGHSSKIVCSNQVMYLSGYRYSGHSQHFPEKVTGLQVAASFGIKEIVRLLLLTGADIGTKDGHGRTALHRAASKGHVAVVQLLVEEGADIASKDNNGATVLHHAASYGHDAVARLLVEKGADVTAEDDDGCTALSQAAWRGHKAMVELLLTRKDIALNSESRYGKTPLSWAAEGGQATVVEIFLKQPDIEVDSKGKDGRTPLSLAAGMGHAAVVKLLLNQQHIEADSKSKNGRTPLSWAAGGGHAAVVELLLCRHDVEADSKSQNGLTPLSWAAWGGYTPVIEQLLDRTNADINSKNKNNRTPLSWAAGSGHAMTVMLFLGRQDIEADSKSRNGKTPLSWAAGSGHAAVVELFLNRQGVRVNSNDEKGQTPLHWAAEKGHLAVVELLLDQHGINPDFKSTDGRTPLSLAAGMGHAAVVKLLLNRQPIKADSRSKNGRTPLSWATGGGHVAVVELLLGRQDVHINYEDDNGKTPLHWATEKGHEAMVGLLLDRADVEADCKDKNDRTPLSLAAERGNLAIAELFLGRQDIDADTKSDIGQTPLSWAAEFGHTAVMKLLLGRSGVETDAKSNTGWTPLSEAASRGHLAAVELLLSQQDVMADSKTDNGRTPLSWAASRGHTAVVKLLLSRQDVDVNSNDDDGRTPLSWAAEKGKAAVVKLLLCRNNVKVDSSDSLGRTPLLWATENGHKAVIELLQHQQDV